MVLTTLVVGCPRALGQTVKLEIEAVDLPPHLTIRSELGVTNVIEYTETLATNQWRVLTNLVVTNSPYVVVDFAEPAAQRFYRVVIPGDADIPAGMALIPAGSFTMGNCMSFMEGSSDELPTHAVYLSGFCMDRTEVTKALWDEVYSWAVAHGYSFENHGMGKAANHPVQTVSWYDMVKWCNARSEKEGRVVAYYTDAAQTTIYRTGQVDLQNDWVKWNAGYRLPTEAEWEKAARGGVSGKRFPCGDTISHGQANYYSSNWYDYDVSSTRGYHPIYGNNPDPFTSSAGSFAPNGYGLYDMAGNVWEWCWDWLGLYSSDSQTDPHGPTSGSNRVIRGGSWDEYADRIRSAVRSGNEPGSCYSYFGFRCALGRP
jgi:formylglycine-generating enzyme required for sulfatase activity